MDSRSLSGTLLKICVGFSIVLDKLHHFCNTTQKNITSLAKIFLELGWSGFVQAVTLPFMIIDFVDYDYQNLKIIYIYCTGFDLRRLASLRRTMRLFVSRFYFRNVLKLRHETFTTITEKKSEKNCEYLALSPTNANGPLTRIVEVVWFYNNLFDIHVCNYLWKKLRFSTATTWGFSNLKRKMWNISIIWKFNQE